jgi:hypothetical protein
MRSRLRSNLMIGDDEVWSCGLLHGTDHALLLPRLATVVSSVTTSVGAAPR